LSRVEELYQDLIGIIETYHMLFFGGEFDFREWEKTSQAEVKTLIELFEAYKSKN